MLNNTSCLVKVDRPVWSIVLNVEYKICFLLSILHKNYSRISQRSIHRHTFYISMQNDIR
jgi:hypothetical protein